MEGPGGGSGVIGATSMGGLLDRNKDSEGGAPPFRAARIRQRPGMPAEPAQGEAIARRSRDAGDDSEPQSLALEQRPLLDMQFDPAVVMALGKECAGQRPGEASRLAHRSQRTLLLAASGLPSCGPPRRQ